SAGTIGLTGGSIDLPSAFGGPADLVGDRGFTFNGFVNAVPLSFNRPLVPGTPISLDLLASGGDVRGSGTLDGVPYTLSTLAGPDMTIHIQGEFIAPPHGSDDTVTLVEPVTWISQGLFPSEFLHTVGMNSVHETLVANSVTATTTLTFLTDPFQPQRS